jgi:alanine dehydrogenase
MKPDGTVLLTRLDVAALLTIDDCTLAVERAFRMYGEGKTSPPAVLGVYSRDGGFHIKAGVLELERSYFAAKVNANFPQNPKQFGLPLIQGVIVLCDGVNGYPLAVMDSIEITIQRTGATTAVAAKYLARTDSKVLTICGCGNQGQISLKALANFFSFNRVFAFDADSAKSKSFASHWSEAGVNVAVVHELPEALEQSDIVVTCTPANKYFVKTEHVRPGTFVAAVGADSEKKQELQPALLSENKTVVDILEQCATIGELHHALDAKLMTKKDVHAELGEIVAGRKRGRLSSDEIIVFDSTGIALQDVVTAAVVYEKAVNNSLGKLISFAGTDKS